jgi:hypothetical protein
LLLPFFAGQTEKAVGYPTAFSATFNNYFNGNYFLTKSDREKLYSKFI